MKFKLNYYALLIAYMPFALVEAVRPKTIMGDESGDIKRCKYPDMSDCETLSSHGSAVSALAVAGEFLYVGLRGGRLRRCPLFHASNCTTFHTLRTDIYDIGVHGTHLYLATAGGISKCGLRKYENCEMFFESESPIQSIAVFENELYAGTDSALLVCTLSDTANCTSFTNTTSTIIAIGFYGKNLYLGLENGLAQQCNVEDCTELETLFKTEAEITDIDVFDGDILVSLDSGEILLYNIENNETVTAYHNNNSAVTKMYTIYATKSVVRHYVGESTACVWQRFFREDCPPYVVYYDVQSRAALELRVKDGLVYTTQGELFDTSGADDGHTGGAIFVMDASGKLFASNPHPIFLLHHSSLMRGTPAAAAGEIKVTDGEIQSISSCSGHYRPSAALVKQAVSSLERQGYDKKFRFIDCMRRRKHLMIDLDYRKTDLYYKVHYEKLRRKIKEVKN